MSGGQRDGVDRPTGEPRLGRAVGAFPGRRMRCVPRPCPAANAMALTALRASRGWVGRSAYFRPPLRCVPMPAPAVNAMALTALLPRSAEIGAAGKALLVQPQLGAQVAYRAAHVVPAALRRQPQAQALAIRLAGEVQPALRQLFLQVRQGQRRLAGAFQHQTLGADLYAPERLVAAGPGDQAGKTRLLAALAFRLQAIQAAGLQAVALVRAAQVDE